MVDPEEYIGDKPTTYSHVYLEYEPSPVLNESLRQFIKPNMRTLTRFAQVALRSQAYLAAPIVPGGYALEHPPAVKKHLYMYQNRLDAIKDHQLRLASFVDMRTLRDESLMLHFELLPDELERRALGQLALKNGQQDRATIGAVARIPAGAYYDPHGEAAAELRGLLAVSHPAYHNKQHTTPAPLENGMWVKRPVLRDKAALKVAPEHPDIIKE